jgi:excisionase family DNA binding protein
MSEPTGFPTVALLLERLIAEVQGVRSAIEARATSAAPPAVCEALWTVAEVAAYVKCSESKVYQGAEAGTIPNLHVGGQLRFEPEAVRRWARGDSRHGSKNVLPFKGTR